MEVSDTSFCRRNGVKLTLTLLLLLHHTTEFREMMEAIDRVNAGLPAPHPDFLANMGRSLQRSGTGDSKSTASMSLGDKHGSIANPLEMTSKRT